jgi:DNA-binding response OmpR family regulator
MLSVLIIEDNPGISRLVEFKLKQEGMDVRMAMNGIDGLEMARNSKPDLILLDVMLPGISGFEVLHALKSDAATSDISVIMLTSKSREEDIERGFAMGAAEYIPKPFKLGELMMRINRVIGK